MRNAPADAPPGRLPVAAGFSLALFLSALAVHLIFFRRAKRDLGF
jgi:hypothetical protein